MNKKGGSKPHPNRKGPGAIPTPSYNRDDVPNGKRIDELLNQANKPRVLSRWADHVEKQIEYKMDEAQQRQKDGCGSGWHASELTEQIHTLALCRIALALEKKEND